MKDDFWGAHVDGQDCPCKPEVETHLIGSTSVSSMKVTYRRQLVHRAPVITLEERDATDDEIHRLQHGY